MHCTHLVQSLYVVYLLLSVKENEKHIFSFSEKPGCQVEQTRSSTRSMSSHKHVSDNISSISSSK